MALEDLKFQSTDFTGKDIASLPDRPNESGMTAAELKARFDYIPKMMIALGNYNKLIEALESAETGSSGADNIGASTISDIDGTTVGAQLQSIKSRADALNAETQNFAAVQAQETKNYAAEQAAALKKYVDSVVLKAGAVESVNGKAGAVELTAVDVGAADNTLSNVVEIANWNTIRALIGAKSNENLLDNWYFADPIDQRGGWVIKPNSNYLVPGESTAAGTTDTYYKVDSWAGTVGASNCYFYKDGTKYVTTAANAVRGYVGAGYGIDRWKKNVGFVTTTLTEDGVKLTNANAIGPGAFGHWQIIDNWQALIGKTVTFSVLVKSRTGGNVHAFVGGVNSGGRAYTANFGSDYGLYSSTIQVNSEMDNLNCIIRFVDSDNAEVSVIAAKLELGDKQTLAHQDANGNWVLSDPPPNKALELAKCQRYALKLGGVTRFHSVQVTSNVIDFTIPTPITMRTNPTLVTSDWVVTDLDTMTTYTDFTFTVSGAHDTSNGFTIRAVKANHGITRAMIGTASSNLTTIVSADL